MILHSETSRKNKSTETSHRFMDVRGRSRAGGMTAKRGRASFRGNEDVPELVVKAACKATISFCLNLLTWPEGTWWLSSLFPAESHWQWHPAAARELRSSWWLWKDKILVKIPVSCECQKSFHKNTSLSLQNRVNGCHSDARPPEYNDKKSFIIHHLHSKTQ